MAYIEGPDYCPISEYYNGRSSRLICEQLQPNEVYLLMLSGVDNGQEVAFKAPTRVVEVQAREVGIHVVRFCALDEDYREYHNGSAEFRDGYWINGLDEVEPDDIPVKEAYFKRHSDDFDDFLRRVTTGLSVPSLSG